jgi:histidinol phosphatase-like PHP family hydrolase
VLFDYHVHLHHSPCTAKEMKASSIVGEAERLGLQELGMINHMHPDTKMSVFEQSREEVDAQRESFTGKLLLGCEVDLINQKGETCFHPNIRSHVDYVTLGMGHYQLEWVEADFSVSWQTYLNREAESLLRALEENHYNIVVHPFISTALNKYAPHYVGQLHLDAISLNLLDKLADVMLERGTAVEFHCREIFVCPERLGGTIFIQSFFRFLDFLRDKGVKVVAGSDAHKLFQMERINNAPSWAVRPL